MKVGDGVIIDGSKLGLHGGQLTGVVDCVYGDKSDAFQVILSRKVEAEMMGKWWFQFSPDEDIITAAIPNCGHWLGKEMP